MTARQILRTALAATVLLLAACGGGDGGGAGGGNGGGDGGGSGPAPAPFVIRVASPIRAMADSTGQLRVQIERRAGFAGAVRIGLANAPAGVTAPEVTSEGENKEGAEAWLPLSFGADVLAGASLTLTVRAEGEGHQASAALEVTVEAAQPRSQELIAQALAAGRIERGTALLYRAYAQLGDARLPPELAGSGSAEEDIGLARDIERERATLSADALAALEPFLVRPDDPRSVFSSAGGPATGRASASKGARRTAAERCSGAQREWITLRSGAHPVRAWTLCTEVATLRPQQHLKRVIEVVDKVYGSMVALMGPAVPDLWGDGTIDIYIVPPLDGAAPPREDGYTQLTGVRGLAVPQAPFAGTTGSGYILIPSRRMDQQGHATTLIHELFHVLQFAHNFKLEDFWFYEASATWASVHFNRTAPVLPADNALVHTERFAPYQRTAFSLLRTDGRHEYMSYIWPHFMEHKGDKALIGGAWRQLAQVASTAGANDVLASVFPFREHFRDFAYRNLNRDYLPGDALPKSKRHVDLDRTFPDALHQPQNRPPKLRIGTSTTQAMQLAAPLEPLAAGYFDAEVDDDAVREVVFELGGVQLDGIDVDALVKIDGIWESGPRDLAGKTELRFCRDRPGEKLDEITFIVGNHRHQPEAKQAVALRARGSPLPCRPVWEGTITTRYQRNEAATRYEATTNASVAFEPDDSAPAAGTYRLRAGTYSHEALYDHFGRTPPCRTSERASGTMAAGPLDPLRFGSTSAGLTVFQLGATLQYLGEGSTAVGMQQTSNCSGQDETVTLPMTIAWWNTGGLREASPDGKTLAGTSAAPDGLGGTVTITWGLTRRD